MIIKANTVMCNILLFFIVLYFSQGALYSEGSIVAKLCLGAILSISLIYLIKSLLINAKKSSFFYLWGLLLLINTFGYILVFEPSTSNIYYSQYKSILLVIITFYPFYYFGYKNHLSDKKLKMFFIFSLFLSALTLYINRQSALDISLTDNINFVDNTAYTFVALLPYIFLWDKNKKFSFLTLLFIIFLIIQSSKRGAFICGVVFLIIYSLYQFKNNQSKRKLQSTIFTLFGITLLLNIFYKFYQNNEFLVNRIIKATEGNASGRDIIYTNLLNNWYYSDSLINQLIGFGFVSTIDLSGTGNLAHNDWLELLVNFGLLGVLLYMLILASLFKFSIFSNIPRTYQIIILSIAIIWLLQTLFSMHYTSINSVFNSILVGYCMGQSNRIKYKQLI